jgi:hypothetical protein
MSLHSKEGFMDTHRIKIKIGEHEFEAEGPADVVERQFETFKELIANTPRQPNVSTERQGNQVKTNENAGPSGGQTPLDKIMKIDGRVVSLTVKPQSEGTAALLVLLGHKVYHGKETATASELRDGLEHSGYRFARVDRLMQPLCDEGAVIKIGTRKATRYRLTNPGVAQAEAAAREAIAQVA